MRPRAYPKPTRKCVLRTTEEGISERFMTRLSAFTNIEM